MSGKEDDEKGEISFQYYTGLPFAKTLSAPSVAHGLM
jgi:hypothetical protein